MTFRDMILFLAEHDAEDLIVDYCYLTKDEEEKNKTEDVTVFISGGTRKSLDGTIRKVFECEQCTYCIPSMIDIDLWSYCPRCGRKIVRS